MMASVTIIVATKNSLPRLRSFIADFRRAPPGATTLVVVDGGSTDGTADWLPTLADDVRWISRPDDGIAEAWNRGVAIADGDWVLFLGCDDRVGDPAAWRSALERMGELPADCAVAAFPVEIVSPDGMPIEVIAPRVGRHAPEFLAVNTVPHQAAFHRRRLWDELGPFDTRFSVGADYEFLLRTLTAGCDIRACGGDPPTRMAFGGMSKRDALHNLLEFRAAQIKHGVRRFRIAWWTACLRAVLRRSLQPLLGMAAAARLADAVRRLRGLPRAWTVR